MRGPFDHLIVDNLEKEVVQELDVPFAVHT
jgi:hypothetical protein